MWGKLGGVHSIVHRRQHAPAPAQVPADIPVKAKPVTKVAASLMAGLVWTIVAASLAPLTPLHGISELLPAFVSDGTLALESAPMLVTLAAWAGTALWAGALWIIDTRHHRLPDALTIPAALGATVAATLFAPHALWGLLWALGYLVIGITIGGVGGGDIKLAVPLGVTTMHAAGLGGVLVGVVGASAGTIAWATITRRPGAAHGPGMLLGTALAVAIGA